MLRLARLPAPPARLVRATPGHANPHFLDRTRLLDRTHPAARLALRHLPALVTPHFTLRAFPNAVLHEPVDFVPVNPLLATALVRARKGTHSPHKWWANLATSHPKQGSKRWDSHTKFIAARHIADARTAALVQSGRRTISLLFHTPKKATSKSCVIRRRLRSKMTAAISLVVGRNADAVETDQPASPLPSLVRVLTLYSAQPPHIHPSTSFVVLSKRASALSCKVTAPSRQPAQYLTPI